MKIVLKTKEEILAMDGVHVRDFFGNEEIDHEAWLSVINIDMIEILGTTVEVARIHHDGEYVDSNEIYYSHSWVKEVIEDV